VAGVEIVSNWYYRLILQDIAELDKMAQNILPGNRSIVNAFVSSPALDFVEDIMSGIQITDPYDGIDSHPNHGFLVGQFKEYILKQRSRIAGVLDQLKYCIEENTLALVIGATNRLDTVSTVWHIALSCED
jgi:hypothetical protein